MNFQTGIDMFDNNEKLLINEACKGVAVKDLTRDRLLKGFLFARNVSTEQDILEMLEGLIAKVESLSDEDWDSMKMRVPFDTCYDLDCVEERSEEGEEN